MLLLRHAAASWNEQKRRLGSVDQPLTPAGRRSVREWAGSADRALQAVCCSDLERARETAGIIASTLALGEVSELGGLREQDQGEWTGLTKEKIKLRWPERARERPLRPVGGEPPEAVLTRTLEALWTIAAEHDGRRVLAVTHSQVIRTLEHAMGLATLPLGHLEGRWLTISSSAARGPARVEMLSANEVTAGRGPASHAGIAGRIGGSR